MNTKILLIGLFVIILNIFIIQSQSAFDDKMDDLFLDCMLRCLDYSNMNPDDAPLNSCMDRCDDMYL